MISMRRFGLSKSKITAFEQCPKKLWLATHRPELAQLDDGAEARFATGHEVGDEACRQCAGGVMVQAEPNLAAALETTRALIESGHDAPIFEATFEHEGVLVRCDVLEPDGVGGWRMAEVKSSGGPKPYHKGDLATQIWVVENAGAQVSRRETIAASLLMPSCWLI
jgi:CRISPR/Cas system-associated exonuclease Cas4 (RecB family)